MTTLDPDVRIPELDAIPVGDLVVSPETVGDDSLLADQYQDLMTEIKARHASRAPAGPSLGIDQKQRLELRRVILRAGYKSYSLRRTMTYSEGPDRWSGINEHLLDWGLTRGFTADCSAWTTWDFWVPAVNWLRLPDFVNGAAWAAGFTGTQVLHGLRVDTPQTADLAFFGDLALPYHVALVIGPDRLLSMGRPGAPEVVPFGPVTQFRRYVL